MDRRSRIVAGFLVACIAGLVVLVGRTLGGPTPREDGDLVQRLRDRERAALVAAEDAAAHASDPHVRDAAARTAAMLRADLGE